MGGIEMKRNTLLAADPGGNRPWRCRIRGRQPRAWGTIWRPERTRHDAERWSRYDGEHGRNDGHDEAHARKHDGRRQKQRRHGQWYDEPRHGWRHDANVRH